MYNLYHDDVQGDIIQSPHGITSMFIYTRICTDYTCFCPRCEKTFSMINSAEHEILNAHKYKNIMKFNIFQAQKRLRMLFFPLINVKIPTTVGILTYMSGKIFMLC